MDTPITLTFNRGNYSGNIGKVVIPDGEQWARKNQFFVYFADDCPVSFVMKQQLRGQECVWKVFRDDVEICWGYVDGAQFAFCDSHGVCVRESTISPFVAAAQVIYNIL